MPISEKTLMSAQISTPIWRLPRCSIGAVADEGIIAPNFEDVGCWKARKDDLQFASF